LNHSPVLERPFVGRISHEEHSDRGPRINLQSLNTNASERDVAKLDPKSQAMTKRSSATIASMSAITLGEVAMKEKRSR
jgi:hypothetical protein